MVKLRVLTALALAAVLLGAIFGLSFLPWCLFVAIIVVFAAREWFALVGVHGQQVSFFTMLAAAPVVVTGFAGVDASRIGCAAAYFFAVVFWFFVVPNCLKRRPVLSNAFWRYVAVFFLLVPASLAMATLRDSGPWTLLGAMAAVWIADIAAFFVGRRWGKRKLAPNISPGKSQEGVIGAATGVAIYAVILVFLTSLPKTISVVVLALFLGLVFTGLSVVGDLFESHAKRQAGVKDSGNLLPGHGGILDRIDSLLSTLPFAGALLLAWQWWA